MSGICLANFIFGYRFLKESLSDENRQKSLKEVRKGRFEQLFRFLKFPLVGSLIGVFFLSSLAMSTMEATLVLFVGDRFQWGLREVSFGFAYIGLIIVLSQGFLVRRLLPIVGEKKMLVAGLTMMGVGLAMIAISTEIWILAVSQTILAFGASFTNPSSLGSISLLAPPEDQGSVLGTTQGTASLGRIIGPALGGFVYTFSIISPFVIGGLMALTALGVVLSLFSRLPEHGKN